MKKEELPKFNFDCDVATGIRKLLDAGVSASSAYEIAREEIWKPWWRKQNIESK